MINKLSVADRGRLMRDWFGEDEGLLGVNALMPDEEKLIFLIVEEPDLEDLIKFQVKNLMSLHLSKLKNILVKGGNRIGEILNRRDWQKLFFLYLNNCNLDNEGINWLTKV